MRTVRPSIAILACMRMGCVVPEAHAQETTTAAPIRNVSDGFLVGDIRVQGLQRIAEGTVFNYLPVNIGDTLDPRRIAEAVKSLYATGFFRDVELRRDGSVLIVAVVERPTIESFEVKGNKDIKTEDLEKSLRSVGLASGKSFDQSVLDEVKRYLTEQYFSRGKYSVVVDARAEDVLDNKVKVSIDIHEGQLDIRRRRVHGPWLDDDPVPCRESLDEPGVTPLLFRLKLESLAEQTVLYRCGVRCDRRTRLSLRRDRFCPEGQRSQCRQSRVVEVRPGKAVGVISHVGLHEGVAEEIAMRARAHADPCRSHVFSLQSSVIVDRVPCGWSSRNALIRKSARSSTWPM